MKTQANNKHKNTSNYLREQVIKILHSKGLSKVFNNQEFNHFKNLCKNSFNLSQAIADKFSDEYQNESDFNQYIF